MTRFREAFPILTVDDVDRAVDLYCSALGFEKTYGFEANGAAAFAFLRLEPLGIGVARRRTASDADVALWVYADDVDAAARELSAAGAEELVAPADQAWGERTCTFRDPDGHVIHVGMRR